MRSPLLVFSALLFCACGAEEPYVALFDEIAMLANPPPPAVDRSNAFIGDRGAEELGRFFYFDPDFSGYATEETKLLEPMASPARAARGEKMELRCATCHDLTGGGTDHTDDAALRNDTSIGAGAYDVNSQPTINAAYNTIIYWNGRTDSLWGQVAEVTESRVSMFGSRLRVAWRIADAYREQYAAVFPDAAIPAEMDSIEAQVARLLPDGTCRLEGDGSCPQPTCHLWTTNDDPARELCLPRFPLEGMPGFQLPGELWQCHHGTDDPLQPYGDAFDCMELDDRAAVNRIYVAYAKAIAAFEYTLLSVDSPFDRWVREGPESLAINLSARRGAALFVGKAACVECHLGPMQTDQLFHNIGVPQADEDEELSPYVPSVGDCPEGAFCDCVSDDTSRPRFCFPNGHRDGLRLLQDTIFRRDSVFSDDDECQEHRRNHIDRSYADANPDQCNGVIRYYPYPFDRMTIGQWRTPTLRNVELTGPYMHNGMYRTLDEVIEHYDTGAEEFLDVIGGELDEDIVPLHLTPEERADLVSFMESLTGAPLDPAISSEPALPPRSPFPEASPFRE